MHHFVLEHAESRQNKALYQGLNGYSESMRFESYIDGTKRCDVEVLPKSMPKSTFKDALEHPRTTLTWNEAKVPALHPFLTLFSLEIIVE